MFELWNIFVSIWLSLTYLHSCPARVYKANRQDAKRSDRIEGERARHGLVFVEVSIPSESLSFVGHT